MKHTSRLLLLLLSLLLALSLVSCDRSDEVISDFRDAYWAVEEIDLDDADELAILKMIMTEEDIAALSECEVLVASKAGIPLAGVLVFDSRVDLRHYIESLDEEKQERSAEEGRVRGNCYLFYAGHGALEIFAEE